MAGAGCPKHIGYRPSPRAKLGRLLVRPETAYPFGKATYELNLGCNYDCEHCYLGLKTFEGLEWPQRERLLEAIRDVGVLWLQLTGGEPMVDRLFAAVHTKAYELGMMIEILTNGSRLANGKILDLLTTYWPSKMCLSVYGATAETYDGLTRRPGSFRKFMRGLASAHEAGLQMDLSLMPQYLRKRRPFRGCDAGHTSFHVDPFGRTSICKIGREPNIDLMLEGPSRADSAGRHQRQPAAAPGRLHWVHASGHLRHLYAARPALPQG